MHRDDRHLGAADAALDRAFSDQATPEVALDLGELRLAVFSDQRKGAGAELDAFRRCEGAYAAALGYYLEMGYDLLLLGDAEDLWEEAPQAVVDAYRATLELEGEFQRAGRYTRLWGDRDARWRHPRAVAHHLEPLLPELQVHAAFKVRVRSAERTLGILFFVHGHQADEGDLPWSWVARLALRHGPRPLARRLLSRVATAATDDAMRARHDQAIARWACWHPARPVVIAGHTQRPVFIDNTPRSTASERSLKELNDDLVSLRASEIAEPQALGHVRAELEFRLAEERRPVNATPPVDPPCYLNPGGCASPTGEVTGLELAEGEVRLVRWPDKDNRPEREVLRRADLGAVLAAARVDRHAEALADRRFTPNRFLVTAVVIAAFVLGFLPLVAIAGSPLRTLLPAGVVWTASAAWRLRNITVRRRRIPTRDELSLAVLSAAFPASLTAGIALVGYGVAFAVTRLISGAAEPGGVAPVDTAVGLSFALGLMLAPTAATSTARQLYPERSGELPAFAGLLANRKLRTWIIGVCGLILALATAAVALRGTVWGIVFAILLAVVVLPSSATIFMGTRTTLAPQVAQAVDRLSTTLRHGGYTVVPAPQTGDSAVDPLLSAVDLLAYDDAQALAVKIEVGGRERSNVGAVDVAALPAATAALGPVVNRLRGRPGSVQAVLALDGADATPDLIAFCQRFSVRLVHIAVDGWESEVVSADLAGAGDRKRVT
jgi:hypothetical protein